MINWIRILKVINYKFDSIGASSIIDVEHKTFGKLSFSWVGNKNKIDICFQDTCTNCICEKPTDIVSCDCSWLGFQELKHTDFNTKTFKKSEVQKLIQPTLF